MDKTLEELIQKIKDNGPYYIYYVDRNDTLNESPDTIQKVIAGDDDAEGDFLDSRDTRYSIDQVFDEVFDEEERELIRENEWGQEIEDVIRSLDESTPLRDLCRNTKDQTVLVDLDFYFEYNDSWQERHKQARKFMNKLKIPLVDNPTKPGKKMYNQEVLKKLDSLLINSYYGGNIYAVIKAGLSEFYNEQLQNIEVEIEDVLIYDSCNGAGDMDSLPSYLIPNQVVSRKDLLLERNMTIYPPSDCFGCSDLGACNYSFTDEKITIKGEVSTEQEKARKEYKEQEKEFKKTGCGGWSAPYRFHTTFYQNEPMSCGNKCKHCGRLWLD